MFWTVQTCFNTLKNVQWIQTCFCTLNLFRQAATCFVQIHDSIVVKSLIKNSCFCFDLVSWENRETRAVAIATRARQQSARPVAARDDRNYFGSSPRKSSVIFSVPTSFYRLVISIIFFLWKMFIIFADCLFWIAETDGNNIENQDGVAIAVSRIGVVKKSRSNLRIKLQTVVYFELCLNLMKYWTV